MKTLTIKINERTKAGRTFMGLLEIFSKQKKGVEIIAPAKSKRTKEYPISKNIPNAETIKVFKDTDKNIGLTKTKSHKDLLEKLYS